MGRREGRKNTCTGRMQPESRRGRLDQDPHTLTSARIGKCRDHAHRFKEARDASNCREREGQQWTRLLSSTMSYTAQRSAIEEARNSFPKRSFRAMSSARACQRQKARRTRGVGTQKDPPRRAERTSAKRAPSPPSHFPHLLQREVDAHHGNITIINVACCC